MFETKRASTRMHETTLIIEYLPTNDTIAKVTPNDLDLLFQSKNL